MRITSKKGMFGRKAVKGLTIREEIQKTEEKILSPAASLSRNTRGREVPEEECPFRTPYQRDRDRILHCKAFRRLKHKTQVFLSPQGDHYRTRLTHTLEVSQIARTIARALRLNEDLTEAISLGHDLGHTPFGHAGEKVLNEMHPGGFRHYEQSVRVVEKLEKEGQGLNLTWEVRNGILCHTRGEEAATLEGRIVRLADKIAYLNHDMDDAIRAGVLSEKDVPPKAAAVLGETRTRRIDCMVRSVVENSRDGEIRMREDVQEAFDLLHDFMYREVYLSPKAKPQEYKVPNLLITLYGYYLSPGKLPEEAAMIAQRDGLERAVCDYIAGMTDQYAVETFRRLFVPESWSR